MKKISMLLAMIVVSLCLVGNVAGANPKKVRGAHPQKVIGANPGAEMGASSGEKWVLKKGEPFYLSESDIRKIWMRGYIEQGDERKGKIEKGLQDGRIIKYKTDQIVEIGRVVGDGLRDIIEIEVKVITDKERKGWVILRYFAGEKYGNTIEESPIVKRYLPTGQPFFLFEADIERIKYSWRSGVQGVADGLFQKMIEDGRILVYSKDMILRLRHQPHRDSRDFDSFKAKVIFDSGRPGFVLYSSLKKEAGLKQPELSSKRTKSREFIMFDVGGQPLDKWFLKANSPLFLLQKDVEEIEDIFSFGRVFAGETLIESLYKPGRVVGYAEDQRVKIKGGISTVPYELVEVEMIFNGQTGWIRQRDLKRTGNTFEDVELKEK